MSDVSLSTIECLSPGLYTQRVTVASREAVAHLLVIMQRFIEQRAAKEPLYILLDASSLDIAYTPRVRELPRRVFGKGRKAVEAAPAGG